MKCWFLREYKWGIDEWVREGIPVMWERWPGKLNRMKKVPAELWWLIGPMFLSQPLPFHSDHTCKVIWWMGDDSRPQLFNNQELILLNIQVIWTIHGVFHFNFDIFSIFIIIWESTGMCVCPCVRVLELRDRLNNLATYWLAVDDMRLFPPTKLGLIVCEILGYTVIGCWGTESCDLKSVSLLCRNLLYDPQQFIFWFFCLMMNKILHFIN